MQSGRVAIIGGGPGGITSAKTARECGLVPTVFERARSAGGVWRKPPSFPWDSMRTNYSFESMCFSDFPWKENPHHFPSRRQLCEYLHDYIHAFDLQEYIRFNDGVEKADLTENGWRITAEASGSDVYEYLIVASGVNTKATLPDVPGLQDKFSGRVLHAAAYQNPEPFRDQTVLVIGNAYSGPDICSELARGGAKRVVNFVRRPLWFLGRYRHGFIPYDWLFSRRTGSFLDYGESIMKGHKVYEELCGRNPGDVCEALRIDPEKDLPYTSMSASYLQDVENGDIEIRKGLAGFEGSEAVFENGERIQVDAVICGTGYHVSLPFFNDSILHDFQPEFWNKLQPLILHKNTFPPTVPNLAFVGVFRGATFAEMELQARWACMVCSGQIPPPSQAEIHEGIREELNFRHSPHKTQIRYNHKFDDALAKIIGAFPEADLGGSGDAELAKWLWEGPILAAHYRLCGPYAKREAAIDHIRKVNEKVERMKAEI